jgi:hypothetical protein
MSAEQDRIPCGDDSLLIPEITVSETSNVFVVFHHLHRRKRPVHATGLHCRSPKLKELTDAISVLNEYTVFTLLADVRNTGLSCNSIACPSPDN